MRLPSVLILGQYYIKLDLIFNRIVCTIRAMKLSTKLIYKKRLRGGVFYCHSFYLNQTLVMNRITTAQRTANTATIASAASSA